MQKSGQCNQFEVIMSCVCEVEAVFREQSAVGQSCLHFSDVLHSRSETGFVPSLFFIQVFELEFDLCYLVFSLYKTSILIRC